MATRCKEAIGIFRMVKMDIGFELNPIYRSNPFFKYIKKMGKYQKQEKIMAIDIINDLDEMKEIRDNLSNDRAKNEARYWIEGIEQDLNDASKYILRDGYYEKIKNNGEDKK
jgi:predicted DNA-binding protein